MVIALGHVACGIFSNNDALRARWSLRATRPTTARWQLPLWDDYHDGLASNFADFANIARPRGRQHHRRLFPVEIREEVRLGASRHRRHRVDREGKEKGATGRPVPLLATWLLAQEAQPV